MSRIRTVKPELFKHEDLFDAEQNSQLPLRLAFIGLFTVADCQGRFRWRPRSMKLDILPYDTVDFAAVLNALEQAGFIERYDVDGETYGVIPSFTRHQVFQTKEQAQGSHLPPPKRSEFGNDTGTVPEQYRDRTGTVPGQQEGKGKEEEGEQERKGDARPRVMPAPASKTPCPADLAITPELQAWAIEHGYHEDLQQHLDRFRDKAQAKGYQYSDWRAALRNAIRDDWAGLRNQPSTAKTAAARGGGRAPVSSPVLASNPKASEFAALMGGYTVIEGECAHVAH